MNGIINRATPKEIKGDCECCPDKKDVVLYSLNGMMMCEGCRDLQVTATATIQHAHAVDTAIQTKPDLFLADTVAATELRAAIDNDSTIPAEQKQFRYTLEMKARFEHLQHVLFEQKQTIQDTEKRVKEMQRNVQVEVGKLHSKDREHFKNLDINYVPVKQPKPVKPAKVSAPGSTFTKGDKEKLYEACRKYDIEQYASRVRSMMVARKIDAETAAKDLAELMKS